jgi:hypothetical protein
VKLWLYVLDGSRTRPRCVGGVEILTRNHGLSPRQRQLKSKARAWWHVIAGNKSRARLTMNHFVLSKHAQHYPPRPFFCQFGCVPNFGGDR